MSTRKRSGAKALRTRDGSALARELGEPDMTVLHIDDDPNDTELLRAAVRKAEAPFVLHNVEDGEQAMAYLSGQGVYADRERYQLPSLILLDLKMPRATGFEILSWIRNHPELGDLPVVVLSGSELQEDIRRAYATGANSYHVKPLGFEALVALVRSLNDSWSITRPRATV
jgi:CheY-like chemotaxis protein